MSDGSSSFTSFAGLFGGQHPKMVAPSANCHPLTRSVGRRDSLMDHDDENVFQDPDWYMEQETSPSSDVPATMMYRSGKPNLGSFSAIAGMSPCLGLVPPMESLYYSQQQQHKATTQGHKAMAMAQQSQQATYPIATCQQATYPIATSQQQQRRRRHFSLEDYHEDVLDDSSSSNESASCFFLQQQQQQNVGRDSRRRGDDFRREVDDLNHIKSFMNDFCFGEEALFALDVDTAFISASLKSEFESRLLKAIEGSNPGLLVNFPEGLLRVIAGHVLQEAAEEPYGIKGCILLINFEGDTGLHHLGTLDCDPETPVKTFELTLTLRQGQTSWGQRMARRLSFTSTTTLNVSTSYKLVKKRKYRSDPEV